MNQPEHEIGASSRALALCATLVCGFLYLGLMLASFTLSQRAEHHRSLGVSHDRDAVREDPVSFVRYYATAQGDPYWFYEHGARLAGKPLPPIASPLDDRLARCRDATRYTTTPLLPYRDFECQYPPLAVLYFGLLAAISPNFDVFYQLLRFTQFISMLGIAFLAYRSQLKFATRRVSALGFCAWTAVLMLAIGPRRLCEYDALPALAAAAFLYAALNRSWLMAGIACSAGIWLKAYPAVYVPFALVWAWKTGSWRAAARFTAAAVLASAVILGPWLLTSPRDALGGFRSQGARKYLEATSVPASFLVAGKQLGLLDFSYADELESRVLVSPLSAAIASLCPVFAVIAILLFCSWFAIPLLRAKPAGTSSTPANLRFMLAFLVAPAIFLLFTPLFTPHYIIWLLPGILPMVGISRRSAVAYVITCLLLQIVHPFAEVIPRSLVEGVMAGVLWARNIALVCVVVFAFVDSTRRQASLSGVLHPGQT